MSCYNGKCNICNKPKRFLIASIDTKAEHNTELGEEYICIECLLELKCAE